MKRWTLVLTLAFLALVLLGITVAAQVGGDSVASPLAQPQLRIAHLAPFAEGLTAVDPHDRTSRQCVRLCRQDRWEGRRSSR